MVKTREERLKQRREYYQNNKDKILDREREAHRIHYQNNKEMLKERAREYYQNNKEKIIEYQHMYNENNKDKVKERHTKYYHNTKEIFREQKLEYNKSPAGKKVNSMASWRRAGVNNVTDEMYNNYIATTHCECCSKEFSSSRDRHLDHDHESGEYRWVICCRCNVMDNWKKITH